MRGLGPAYQARHQRCPLCGHELDAASAVDDDAAPREGDFGICISCASVLRYDDELRLEVCPDRAWRASPEAATIERACRAILSIDRRGMLNDAP